MSSIHRILRPGDSGDDVRDLQAATNARLHARDQDDYILTVDGDYGPNTARSVSRAAYLLGITGSRFAQTKVENGGKADLRTQQVIRTPSKRDAAMLKRADARMAAVRKAAAKQPLREKAYKVASGLVGVMEQGGNNMGPMVSKIIRANGGTGPEPWCGDFMAYCYRLAGSKRVTRSWAAVRLLSSVVGVTRTSSPKRGDLVRFTFDHVGMFVRDLGNGEIETLEGNTTPLGAVSDGDGGDGVYRKHRSKSLVQDYLRVSG